MEITSHQLNHPELGNLHVTKFMPDQPNIEAANVVFNSFWGRVTTPDGFALPYEMARLTTRPTFFVERPGTGTSTLPIEGTKAEHDYKVGGFNAIAGLIDKALQQDEVYAAAQEIHTAGFSLGGSAAVLFAKAVESKIASVTIIDPSGFCEVNKSLTVPRFYSYAALEFFAEKVGAKLKRDDVFGSVIPELKDFMKRYGLPEPPVLSSKAKWAEMRNVAMPTNGEAGNIIIEIMSRAAEAKRRFEFRAGFSPARRITDHQLFKQTTKRFAKYDKKYGDSKTVRYGLMQDGPINTWHGVCCSPATIDVLLTRPIESMQHHVTFR